MAMAKATATATAGARGGAAAAELASGLAARRPDLATALVLREMGQAPAGPRGCFGLTANSARSWLALVPEFLWQRRPRWRACRRRVLLRTCELARPPRRGEPPLPRPSRPAACCATPRAGQESRRRPACRRDGRAREGRSRVPRRIPSW